MRESEIRPGKVQLARRNLFKMGGIGLAALLARVMKPEPASAIESTPCFLRSTRIRAADGNRRVEDLDTHTGEAIIQSPG